MPLQPSDTSIEPADPALSQLDFFMGWWHCHGIWPQISTDKTYYWLLHAQWSKLNGWMEWTLYGPSPTSLESKKLQEVKIFRLDYWGYQKNASQFVAHWFEPHGAAGTLTSLGWNGDRLDWEGESSDALNRRIFQRWEIQKMGFKLLRDKRKVFKDDVWQSIYESVECRKLG